MCQLRKSKKERACRAVAHRKRSGEHSSRTTENVCMNMHAAAKMERTKEMERVFDGRVGSH